MVIYSTPVKPAQYRLHQCFVRPHSDLTENESNAFNFWNELYALLYCYTQLLYALTTPFVRFDMSRSACPLIYELVSPKLRYGISSPFVTVMSVLREQADDDDDTPAHLKGAGSAGAKMVAFSEILSFILCTSFLCFLFLC